MIRAKIMKVQCEWRRLGKPWFKRWSEVLNRENPGRLKGWRVVVKVWNSHCMCGVWSSRTMEILWVGWAQLRLQACDFCTPAYLHGCTTASQPPAARTVKMAWIPGWSFAWEALSMDWKWNNGLVQNWAKRPPRLYIITLLIQLLCRGHQVKFKAGWSTSWNPSYQEKYQQPQMCRHQPQTPLLWQKVKRNWRASRWMWKRRVKKLT